MTTKITNIEQLVGKQYVTNSDWFNPNRNCVAGFTLANILEVVNSSKGLVRVDDSMPYNSTPVKNYKSLDLTFQDMKNHLSMILKKRFEGFTGYIEAVIYNRKRVDIRYLSKEKDTDILKDYQLESIVAEGYSSFTRNNDKVVITDDIELIYNLLESVFADYFYDLQIDRFSETIKTETVNFPTVIISPSTRQGIQNQITMFNAENEPVGHLNAHNRSELKMYLELIGLVELAEEVALEN